MAQPEDELPDPVPEEVAQLEVLEPESEPQVELTGHLLLEREVADARAKRDQLQASRDHFARTKAFRELGEAKKQLEVAEVELALKEDEYAAALTEWNAQEQERKQQRRQAFLIKVSETGLLEQATDYLDDQEIVLAAVSVRGSALQFASAELRASGRVVRAAVKSDGLALRFASEPLRNDREICEFAVNQCGVALQYASEQVQNRQTIALAAVSQDGLALRFASSRLQEDEAVVLAAVHHNPYALQFAGEIRRDDREIVLAAVAKCGLALQWASSELRNDPEIVALAVRGCGDALRFASSEIRNNRSVVMDALAVDENDVDDFVRSAERDLADFSERTRDGLQMVLSADETSASMVELLALADISGAVNPGELTATADLELPQRGLSVVHGAVEDTVAIEVRPASAAAEVVENETGPAPVIDQPSVRSPLAYASPELRNDAEVVLRAIERLPAALILASPGMKNDRDVVEAAVRRDGGLLQHASELLQRDSRLVVLAVQTDIAALEYANADVVKELAQLVTPKEIDAQAEAMEKRKPKLELMMTEKLMMRGEDESGGEVILRMEKYSKELLRITSGVEVESTDESDEEAEVDPLITPETQGAVSAAVMRLYGCLDQAPADVLTDRTFIFDAVRQVGLVAFKHSSDVLRGDIELIQLTCDKIARDTTPLDALSEVIRQKRQEAYDAVIKYVTAEGKAAYDAELHRIAAEKEARLRALDSEVDVYLQQRTEARAKRLREEKLARIAAGGSESDSQGDNSDASDDDDEEEAVVDEDAAASALRKELAGTPFSVLKKRAETLGVDPKAVLDCTEGIAGDPEKAIIDLIVDAEAALRLVEPPTPPPTPPVEHHHFAGLLAGRAYVAGHADGPGKSATFNSPSPSGLLIDERHDIIYLTDSNSVRKLTLCPDNFTQETDGSAEVTTLAGGGNAGCKDGFGCMARFRQPSGLVLKMDGGLVLSTDHRDHNHSQVLLICDSWNHKIRELNLLTQEVRTVAGDGQCGDVDGAAVVKNNAGAVARQWLLERNQRLESKPKSPWKQNSPSQKDAQKDAKVRTRPQNAGTKNVAKSNKTSKQTKGDGAEKASDKKRKKATKTKAGTKKKQANKAHDMSEAEAAIKIQSTMRGRSERKRTKELTKAKQDGAAIEVGASNTTVDSDDENRVEVPSEEDQDSGDDEDAMATPCCLCRPTSAVMGSDGTVYISCIGDNNGHGHTIRMLSPKLRRLRTLAGRSGVPGYVDGPATEALFRDPHGLAFLEGHDGKSATLFVADSGNHVVRRLLLRTRGPNAPGGARRATPHTTLVDTVLISAAPRNGILPPKPPVDLDELERKGGPQPKKEKTTNDRLWFVRPTEISVSQDDGTIYVGDEGGHGKRASAAGAGRARLQRLARRGTLYYNPITREYAEAPNDYVISVIHTPPYLQHVSGLALRHGKSLRSDVALENYGHTKHPGDKGSAWFVADGETHTVHTGPCSRQRD